MAKKIKRRHAPPSVPFKAAEHLRSEAEMVAYIEEMFIDGDARALPIALRTLCDALLRLRQSRQRT
jgi:DNA-binding phage protein